MMGKRRLMYLIGALAAGVVIGVAVLVVLGQGGAQRSRAAIGSDAAAAAAAGQVVDPAKVEPLLDKFDTKDPFMALPTAAPAPSGSPAPAGSTAPAPAPAPSSGSTSSSGSSAGSSTSSASALSAKVVVDGKSYSVKKGDKLPSGSPQFSVASIAADSVTFKLIAGQFENGKSTIAVKVGETVKLTKKGGKSYLIKVASVSEAAGGGGGGSSTSARGHSVKVLSITESNGKPMVTLEVDGKTYADKPVGATFTTGWGEIKILAIDVEGQTVRLMRGDQVITLRAGQSVVK